MHRRLVYIYLLNMPSFSSRYFNKIKRTSRLGRLLALSLEILSKSPEGIEDWKQHWEMQASGMLGFIYYKFIHDILAQ